MMHLIKYKKKVKEHQEAFREDRSPQEATITLHNNKHNNVQNVQRRIKL